MPTRQLHRLFGLPFFDLKHEMLTAFLGLPTDNASAYLRLGLRTLPSCHPHEVRTSPLTVSGELAQAARRQRHEIGTAQAAEGLDRVVQWGSRKPSPTFTIYMDRVEAPVQRFSSPCFITRSHRFRRRSRRDVHVDWLYAWLPRGKDSLLCYQAIPR